MEKSVWGASTATPLRCRLTFALLSAAVLALAYVGGISNSSAVYSQDIAQSSSSDIPRQVTKINELVEQVWRDFNLQPSSPASDYEWCRRVYLDVIGRIPTIAEIDAFIGSKSPDKRVELVSRLLYSDEYTEEFARNWATIWSNLLIGRTGGTANNSMISRAGMSKYLRDSFARNKSYDRMVHELITASGYAQPGAEGFNGAVNFLIDKVNDDGAAQATAAVSRLFLGLQVQCTQCHNHPFNDWKQQKYWEFNAFFRQVRAFRGATDMASAQLVDQDFRGESGNADEADLFYELRNGLLKVAYPVFVDGTEISKSGYVNAVNRRQELSQLITASPYFDKAAVNRVWEHFLGYGFTKPVDDLGPHNAPSNSALLQYLADEFRDSGYNLRQLYSWIILSRPYALSSKKTKNNETDDPLLGASPKFSHFYLRQMRAEELYESLMVASGAGANQGSYEQQEEQRNRWLQQFVTAFGTDEGDESTTFNGTIPQVLMMFNGEMIQAAVSDQAGTLLYETINKSQWTVPQKVDRLFLAGLSRPATREEKNLAQQLIQARRGDLREGLKDLWWVILNSNEFIFNH